MPGGCFAEVISQHIDLTAAERAALDRLEERERTLRRGAVIKHADEPNGELFILRRGMAMSYVLLGDGSRQILRFFFAGDMIGLSGLVYRNAPETICALSDVTVCPFEKAALGQLFEEHPRLGAIVLALTQVERLALTDRLAGVGRSSAKARVGALLLDLRSRLRALDPSIGDTFALGLTQEEVGDATGLTSVHVNRMLRRLEQEGLIARENGRVTILDEEALARASNYVNRHQGLELDWLPPRR